MAFLKRLQKFFYEVRLELKKVHWPSRKELTVFTWVVLASIFTIGVFFWVLDSAFTAILRLIIQ